MGTGIMNWLACSCAALARMAGSALAECFAYDQPITLAGTVAHRVAYDPPGFDKDPKHDANEPYLAFVLDWPICTKATEDVDAESSVREMQIMRDEAAGSILRRNVGRKVTVTGTLWHAETDHHHTQVMLGVYKAEHEEAARR